MAGMEMQLVEATKKNAVATIVAALINAANRPHSIAEVQKLMRDVEFTLYPPPPGHGAHESWKKTFNPDEPHK
jgi:hypothetical protein